MNPKMLPLVFLFFSCMVSLIWIQVGQTKIKNQWELGSSFEVRGIDLSHHNGQINYNELDSIDFVFLKASEGTTLIDKTFSKHHKEFSEKKIAIGAYHFFRFDTDGKEQAIHFLKNVEGKKLQLPLIVDVEQDNNPYIEKNIVIKRLHSFIREIKKQTGIKPIIYTNGDGYSKYIEDDFSEHQLWLSSTNSWRPSLIDCTFWQFNIEGNLSAISQNVDLNVFRGSRQDWQDYLQKNKPFLVNIQ